MKVVKKVSNKRPETTKPQTKVAVKEITETLVDIKTALVTDTVEYAMIKQRIKLLEARSDKTLKPQINSAVAHFGIENQDGHKILQVDGVTIKHQKRIAANFNQIMAEEILEKKGLLEKVATKIVVESWEIDEDKLIQAYEAGLLSPQDFDNMYTEKVTWALYVDLDEEEYPEYAALKAMREELKLADDSELPEVKSS